MDVEAELADARALSPQSLQSKSSKLHDAAPAVRAGGATGSSESGKVVKELWDNYSKRPDRLNFFELTQYA